MRRRLAAAIRLLSWRWKLALAVSVGAVALMWLRLPKPSLYPEGLRFSRVLVDREGRVTHVAITPDGKFRVFTPLKDVSDDLITATLLQEDRHYFSHPGVNPLSLVRGLWGAITGQAMGGGSTITMQYARLRFGLHTRSWLGKAVQIFYAVELERHYSKNELLEAYLNLAPYGGNIEGIGAAGLAWCGHRASDITRREAAVLSVLPQSPARRRPNQTGPNRSLANAQQRLLVKLQAEKGWRADPLDASYRLRNDIRLPHAAPHLARRLLVEDSTVAVRGTLDLEKQRIIERTLADFVGRKREVGIQNACALLIHAPSREVLAYSGSAEFFDVKIQGQVDGVMARRSPGSALKPFVYALAMQQGIIHPRSLLRDSRISFGEYNPENFDRGFTGPIAAEDALYRSRNIPAVALTQKLAAPGLYGFLKESGLALPNGVEFYGLSLPLGGGEVSMEELGVLYAMLADDGCAKPLRFRRDQPMTKVDAPLLTREATFLTRSMLKLREDEPQFDDDSVSWKTGTSHGFRDAWAAGIRGEYVLIVWIGNFNGRANPAFVARECAAPLLFDCFRALRLPKRQDTPPPGVQEVVLCAVSGQLPTPHCHHQMRGWFIPGVSPIAPCDIHREVLIDADSGFRLAGDDGRSGLRREIYEFWPPDLMELFRQAGIPRRAPPKLEPGAKSLLTSASHQAPKISSPRPALTYTLRARDPQRQSIPLRADAAPGVHRVFWFAGTNYLGASSPVNPLLWKATPGKWKLHVLDDQGRSTSCEVRVEMVE